MAATSLNDSRAWQIAGARPDRSGAFPDSVQIAPKPIQRLPARGAVQASVVFDAQDRVLVADMTGLVRAFADNGRRLWETQAKGGISATPAVDADAGLLFVGTHTGWVCAFHTANGAVAWRQRLPSTSDSRILSDLLYVASRRAVVLNSWGGQCCALDAASGQIQQTWDAGISPQAGASSDARGNLYFLRAVRGEGIAFLRVAADGMESILHRVQEGRQGASRMIVASAPVLDESRDGAYFVANRDREGLLHAWSLSADRLLWSRPLERGVMATPSVRADGVVVLADMTGSIRGFGPDGSPQWQYATGSEYLLAGPISDAAQRVYLGDPLGSLHVVDAGGAGRVIFEAPRAIQARAAFDRRGRLYVPCTDRHIYVFHNRGVGDSHRPSSLKLGNPSRASL